MQFLISTAYATSTFVLPDGFATSIWSQASDIFGTLSPVVILIVSVLVATLIIEIVIGALRK